jgi:hypothetical protein
MSPVGGLLGDRPKSPGDLHNVKQKQKSLTERLVCLSQPNLELLDWERD